MPPNAYLPETAESVLDTAIADLATGAESLASMPLDRQRELVEGCMQGVARNAAGWVEAACNAKRIPFDQPIAAEEILAGPASVLRYLRLLSVVFRDVERLGTPRLPGKLRQNTQCRTCVPVLPVASLYDSMIFLGLKVDVWLQEDATSFTAQPKAPAPQSKIDVWRQEHAATESLFSDRLLSATSSPAKIAGVLGAGNVSAIPAADMLYKVFHDGQAVLLKLNPVNEYLEPFLHDAFRPLIDANLVRIVRGGAEMGSAVVRHPQVDTLHITGSHHTHDAIVWGADPKEREVRRQEHRPLVTKPITSELGNVTPWIIVPGRYTNKQLQAQAEHIVASIVNNASFNCVATKMIVTSRGWPQRDALLNRIDALLESIPPRFAYYPGAHERFARATGRSGSEADDGSLPWTLIRDARPAASPHLFEEESFVCVCAETALDEPSPEKFLATAVDFVNQRLFGTLSATLTVPDRFRKQHRTALESALARLRYGSICINQWSAVAYALMTPPWGGYPGATIAAPQSGIGHVHNAFFLEHIDKTVLWGPLCNLPKPVWFPSHRRAHQVGWALMRLYQRPSLTRLPAIFYSALRG